MSAAKLKEAEANGLVRHGPGRGKMRRDATETVEQKNGAKDVEKSDLKILKGLLHSGSEWICIDFARYLLEWNGY